LRSGQLQDHDWSKIFSTMAIINERMNMFIDDTPALSPSEMRSRARRLAREFGGVSLIVVDYLQLMQIPGAGDNRVNEVSEISRNLKALAKELNVPVIALSQLSRKCEDRTDKRPMMSDLRESGAIEQDADVIMFVYRDEVYHPDTSDKGTAEILVRKQRNGPIGDVRLTFLGHYCRFDNFAPQAV
jgi:replicative DNA helicase